MFQFSRYKLGQTFNALTRDNLKNLSSAPHPVHDFDVRLLNWIICFFNELNWIICYFIYLY